MGTRTVIVAGHASFPYSVNAGQQYAMDGRIIHVAASGLAFVHRLRLQRAG